MHRSPALRILLAAFLAICSPAMCCCTVKNFVAGADACGQRSCCVMGTSARIDAANQPRSCCDETEGESPSDDDSPPCKCHEKSIELTRLDTGVKISIPANLSELGPMMFTAPWPMLVVDAAHGWMVYRSLTRHHPPPNTLLAQRCLLLI